MTFFYKKSAPKNCFYCKTEISQKKIAIKDACALAPCLNNGKCKMSSGVYTCSCPLEYSGSRCELPIDVDENDYCESSPCLNNSTCVNQPSHFKCVCGPGYFGEKCQIGNEEKRTI